LVAAVAAAIFVFRRHRRLHEPVPQTEEDSGTNVTEIKVHHSRPVSELQGTMLGEELRDDQDKFASKGAKASTLPSFALSSTNNGPHEME
jgi:hypothetical protein